MKIKMDGKKFGRLSVESFAGTRKGHTYWNCICTCGNTSKVEGFALRAGKITSCGCRQKEIVSVANSTHGKSHSSEYKSWSKMKERCLNPNSRNWRFYGGRGISVCEKWMSFGAFLSDMGEKPTRYHSLERINVNGNYDPSNCKWATNKEQCRNKRNTVFVEYDGRRVSLLDLSDRFSVSYKNLWRRVVVRNWEIKRALTT